MELVVGLYATNWKRVREQLTKGCSPRTQGGFDGGGGTAPSAANALAEALGTTEPRAISFLAEIGLAGAAKVRDLWLHDELGLVTGNLTQTISSHGAGLYRVEPRN